MNSLYKQTKFMMQKVHKLLIRQIKINNNSYQIDRYLKI